MQVSKIMQKEQTEFALSTKHDSSAVFMGSLPDSTQWWVLDYRLDGTFLIISDTKEQLVLSCDSTTSTPEQSQLIMSQFNCDESQLWRFDGDHIESVKFKDQVISVSQASLCLSTKSPNDTAQLFKHEVSIPTWLVLWKGIS